MRVSTTAPNTQLGKYQLVRLIASGEMTELWLGLDGERKVALKRIRAEFGDDRKYAQAFIEQARRASILRHDNIVRIHDIGSPTGECFYVMDWIEGVDLRTVLADAHVAEQQIRTEHVMTIMLATCEAFQYAHKKGVFHLDVSPANILIGLDGTVKVVDFGIATAVNRAKTRPGAQEGKVGYMSPELCLGKSADARSDIFSLGVVLYELLTVRRLFKASTDFLTMSIIIEGQIPRPSTVRPGIAPELEELVMKALEPTREARFQTILELRAALEKFCRSNKLDLSRGPLADYATTLAKKARPTSAPKQAEKEPEKEPEQEPDIVSGTLETPTKLRAKTSGGNDSTLIVRPITVAPPGRSKVTLLAIGAIAALAVIGITIYVLQPSGDTPTAKAPPPPATMEPPPAPAVAQPTPDAAAEEEMIEEVEVDEVPAGDREPPPPPPPDPEPPAKNEPEERGALVKLREEEPKKAPEPVAKPAPPKKKKVIRQPKNQPKWDPNALFPEKK